MSDTAILTAALRDFGSAKELARAAGVHLATAHRYRAGALPDAVALTRLMAKSHRIAEAVLRMAGLDDVAIDLQTARLLRVLEQLQAQKARETDAIKKNLEEVKARTGELPCMVARLQRRATDAGHPVDEQPSERVTYARDGWNSLMPDRRSGGDRRRG